LFGVLYILNQEPVAATISGLGWAFLMETNDLMITKHRYVYKYPIDSSSEKLILGTIHPHNHNDFLIPFFYGNQLSLWNILHDAFPDQLASPITLTGTVEFLSENKFAISDTLNSEKKW
jgi:hypothetical protein